VNAVRRLAVLLWGKEVDRALRPVLAVSFASTIAGSTLWSFMGIWAIEQLDAGRELPFVYAVGAILSASAGYFGGTLSDRIGRRRVLLVAQAALTAYPFGLIAIGTNLVPGVVAFACAGAFGSLAGTMSQAIVADLVAPERQEEAYAAVRVASNLGVTIGPPLGGLLLFLGSWDALFAGVGVGAGATFLLALAKLPATGGARTATRTTGGSFAVIARDRVFLLFMASAMFAWLVYVSYAVVMPVSLVGSHGLSAAMWGVVSVVNPLLVAVCQMRLTRSLTGVSSPMKLVAAMLLMGMPMLLFSVSASLAVILLVLVVFVFGEMLWVPTSQTILARLSPEESRGAYMGAFGSGPAVGFALAPLIGLSIRNAEGDTAMWIFFAAASVVAAILGAAACLRVRSTSPALG
jgi:MFS family permease